ncbi:DUF896 domain-containing protein [Listeria fleischmannii]|uniref:UPF0291 protein MCOL2_03631 n=2 Tax=Listeria fleischmannii TaxID=1069827 RepID=W7DPM2_9LIST|nr:DUF896 domain-containing protein [Listeria fleischmannii]EUJ62884.1 hypothetical protein MCOL2_03631 [Listeria fleischmannii FSL S10-1203]
MKELLSKINHYGAKQRNEGLTAEEKAHQAELRQEYCQMIRGTLQDNLHHVTIMDPLGDDVTPNKLKEIKAELKKIK